MSTGELHPFTPARTVRPGEILAEMLIDRRLGPVRAGELCGLPADLIEDLVHGRRSVNRPIAEDLARGLGLSAAFWLDAQARYEAGLACRAEDTDREHERD